MSLQSLPPELLLVILDQLDFLDKHTMGLTSRHFSTLIPPPTYADLLAFEARETYWEDCPCCVGGLRISPWRACSGCKRLRHQERFSSTFGESRPKEDRVFLCFECGLRPLPGEHRFKAGDSWYFDETTMIRCPMCGMDRPAMRESRNNNGIGPLQTDKCQNCYEKMAELLLVDSAGLWEEWTA